LKSCTSACQGALLQVKNIPLNAYCTACFITVDADIEHDEGVLAFYEKMAFF
jgi:hypothetical protein